MGKHGGQVPGHRLPKGTGRWPRGEAGLQGARERQDGHGEGEVLPEGREGK